MTKQEVHLKTPRKEKRQEDGEIPFLKILSGIHLGDRIRNIEMSRATLHFTSFRNAAVNEGFICRELERPAS
jgi:hypothetical protein